MAKKEKTIKVTIKSDGTSEGTSLIVNGADVTKQKIVKRIYFSAYAPLTDGDVDTIGPSQDIFLSWDSEEKDDKGILKTTTYRLAPGRKVVKGLGRGIGDSTILQFDNIADENTYKVTGDIKKLEDAVEIVDFDKKTHKANTDTE